MQLNPSKRWMTGLGVLAAVGLSTVAALFHPAGAARAQQAGTPAQAAPAQPASARPAPAVPAAEPANRPDAPPLNLEEKDVPGVAVTFYPAGADQKPEAGDTRASRMVALYVPHGQSASPFVPPGPFTAVFAGDVNMRLRDTYTFSAEGRGKVTVTVGDTVVLSAEGDDFSKAVGEPIRLSKGKNAFTVKYESPAAGDAALRLLWTVKGEYYAHPVPPTALSHNAGAEAVARGMRVRQGRQLLAELRCTDCHAAPVGGDMPAIPLDPAAASTYAPMAELAMDAPNLSEVGGRLNKDWMTVWINNPHALRPNPHMPRVFVPEGGDENAIDPRAADVAAYLATLGGDSQPLAGPKATEENIARGGQLFTHLNCVACHQPPGAGDDAVGPAVVEGEAPPPARVPLKYVGTKFTPAALTQFLLNPSAHYQWIPMPNFKFTPEEADAVAAFLLSQAAGTLPENLPAGDPAKGKALLASSGCINCHAVGQEKSTLKVADLNAIPKEGWTRGCMSDDAAGRKTAPAYDLTDAQREALLAFAATDRTSLARTSPAEFAARQVASLNCMSCHARDGQESLLATVYDQESRDLGGTYPAPQGEHAEAFAPDQRAPLMTWFGEKLRPEWSAAFIAGQVSYKPRPYLHARMPGFATRAGLLAAGLAAEHGVAPKSPDQPKPDAALVAIGSKLSGKTPNASFSCNQCHAIARQPAFAPFEAPAVNFMHSSERLRKDYYHRWVHNPLSLDPNTKMPAFERDDGRTTITTVYDGDARKQFEAIWQYLLQGKEIQPPAE